MSYPGTPDILLGLTSFSYSSLVIHQPEIKQQTVYERRSLHCLEGNMKRHSLFDFYVQCTSIIDKECTFRVL
jgi:hypothetical protein